MKLIWRPDALRDLEEIWAYPADESELIVRIAEWKKLHPAFAIPIAGSPNERGSFADNPSGIPLMVGRQATPPTPTNHAPPHPPLPPSRYLRQGGTGKAAFDRPKAMLGSVAGGAVRLSAGPGGRLWWPRGIETALSLACGLLDGPATIWAALSTTGMRALRLPIQAGALVR